MPKHCFNILTFNHPSEEFTFYFTDKEQEGVTRIFHALVPKEGELKKPKNPKKIRVCCGNLNEKNVSKCTRKW